MSRIVDQGVVFIGIGSGTNVSGGLVIRTPGGASGQLSMMYSGTFRAGPSFFPGVATDVSLTVQGTLSSGAGLQIGVERQRVDNNNSGLPKWSLVSTYRTDISGQVGGATTFPLQLIAPANLSGQLVDASPGLLSSGAAGETLAVTLRTTDLHGAGQARVIAKICSGNLLASGDFFAISVDG